MATAQHHHEHVDQRPWRSGKHALDWFEQTIWTDHRVCSNCFSLLKSDCWMTWTDASGKRGMLDDSWRTTDAQLGEDLEEPSESTLNVKPLARQRTTCLSCGSVRGLHIEDALSTAAAVERVPELANRLLERGYPVDIEVMYDTVRALKSNPDRAEYDKRIFATAAALGVKHG